MDGNPPGSSVHGILLARYWSGLLCPPSGDLPNSGIEPHLLHLPALAGRLFPNSTTWEARIHTAVLVSATQQSESA